MDAEKFAAMFQRIAGASGLHLTFMSYLTMFVRY